MVKVKKMNNENAHEHEDEDGCKEGMRPCYNLHCRNGKFVQPSDDDDEGTLTDEDCYTCNGTGFVEEGCHCAARCSCECLCGAWDGSDCHCMIDQDDYFDNEPDGDEEE